MTRQEVTPDATERRVINEVGFHRMFDSRPTRAQHVWAAHAGRTNEQGGIMNRLFPWMRIVAITSLLLGLVACEAGDTTSIDPGQDLECSLGDKSTPEDCTECVCTAAGMWECNQVEDCVPGTGRTEPVACVMGDEEYDTGNTAYGDGDDWCNLCTCQDDGEWACDTAVCDNDCTPGETKEEDCNTCLCSDDHLWDCTTLECDDPVLDCDPGDSKVDEDGCSQCKCTVDGVWDCDASDCPESCEGDLVWNECGSACTATCDDPTPMCTEECVAQCECPSEAPILHEGACVTLDACPADPGECVEGDTKTDEDGCSQCVCNKDGAWDCDASGCDAPDCDGGQVWNDCASSCTKTCADQLPACSKECVQACECPTEAPLWENGQCITAAECPAEPTDCTPGTTKTDADGCSVCTCLADGTWSCDASSCPESCEGGQVWADCGSACTPTCADQMPMCTMQCVPKCQCPADAPLWENGQCIAAADCPTEPTGCTPGETEVGEDGCSVCTCLADGTWSCDASACDVPTDCTAGESKEDEDGCSVCTCLADGTWDCDASACAVPTDCTAGETEVGEDGCSVCTCLDDGTWSCDASACAVPTDCTAGDSKDDDDGCSVCTCLDDGTWSCDASACPESCEGGQEWNPCGSNCTPTCDDLEPACLTDDCVAKCECPLDLPILHEGVCVAKDACPGLALTCVMGGQEYQDGDSTPGEGDNWCNDCTCQGGAWACTEIACANECTPGEKKEMDECSSCECSPEHTWVCVMGDCVPIGCTEDDCGPKPGMPNTLCDDQVTMAGPGACEVQEDGACGWTIVECPPVEDKCADVLCPSTEAYCEGDMAYGATFSECHPQTGECMPAPGLPPEQCEFGCADGACVPGQDCPGGQVWDAQSSGCPPLSCGDNQSACLEEIVEGKCVCPQDKPVWYENQCIKLDDCPTDPKICVLGDSKDEECNVCECQAGPDGELGWVCTDAICDGSCWTQADCADDEFCQSPIGSCGNMEGECTPILDVCLTIVDIVCGCDGKEYNNGCEAHADGMNIAKDGPCADTPGGECPDGSPPVACLVNPCDNAECPSHPEALCEANYCGGCNAVFYGPDGAVVECTDDGGSKSCITADGQEYQPGESVPATGENWCNECTCKDTGDIACTLMFCADLCTNDDECPNSHWCRVMESSKCPPDAPDCMACTPYQQEGQSCGGFTVPWAYEQCDPSLTCVDLNPQIADEPGECQKEQVPNTCTKDGEQFDVGESFPGTGDNWCNDCTCQEDGNITCTLVGCPALCATDDECPDTHWCRWMMEDDCPPDNKDCKACTPYKLEGESCGGFTAQWSIQKCDPSLICGDFNEFIPDLPGTCLVPDGGETCVGPDGQELQVGESFSGAGDNWCNTCTCQQDGAIICTQVGCPTLCNSDDDCAPTKWCRDMMPDECPPDMDGCNACVFYAQEGESCGGNVPIYDLDKCSPDLNCVYDPDQPVDWSGTCENPIPQSCEPGTLGLADDGCNDCLCMEDGLWYCNDTACETNCVAGEQKMAADGCNTCNCTVNADGVGTWNCTKKGCTGCTPGETMPDFDDCNVCMCIPEDGLSDDDDDGEANDEFDEKDGPDEMPDEWPEDNPFDELWICTELPECVDEGPFGCTSDFDCDDGFCKTPDGACGGQGQCELYSEFCADIWMPVCGCDGFTYGNACEADAVGVSVANGGECGGGGGPDVLECPPPKQYDGICSQAIAWAMNPATGECCSYPNPCSIPDGMGPSYGNEQACLDSDGGEGGGGDFGGGGGGDFGDGGGGDFGDGGGFNPK